LQQLVLQERNSCAMKKGLRVREKMFCHSKKHFLGIRNHLCE